MWPRRADEHKKRLVRGCFGVITYPPDSSVAILGFRIIRKRVAWGECLKLVRGAVELFGDPRIFVCPVVAPTTKHM